MFRTATIAVGTAALAGALIAGPALASATWPSSDTQTATRQVSSSLSIDNDYIGATRQVPQTILTVSNP